MSTGYNRDRFCTAIATKHIEYMARGIDEYWIIDPERRQATVCCWDNGLYEDTIFAANEPLKSAVVPEFNLSPSRFLPTVKFCKQLLSKAIQDRRALSLLGCFLISNNTT